LKTIYGDDWLTADERAELEAIRGRNNADISVSLFAHWRLCWLVVRPAAVSYTAHLTVQLHGNLAGPALRPHIKFVPYIADLTHRDERLPPGCAGDGKSFHETIVKRFWKNAPPIVSLRFKL
jgi:hypothetical protein